MFTKPFANALFPTLGAVSDLKLTLVIDATFLKASVPMLVTLLGIVSSVNAVFLNASLPMLVTLAGIVISVKPVFVKQ